MTAAPPGKDEFKAPVMRPIERIVDIARWAPSGDNTQPWRFEIVADDHVTVHAFDTRDHCVYDLDGRPSQLSVGALLETIRIAATNFGLRASHALRVDSAEDRPVFDVMLVADPSIAPDALVPFIETRRVQRRALQTRAIRPEEKARLEGTLPPGYQLLWLDGKSRWSLAALLFSSAKIRLITREAFEVHSKVIEWNAKFSEDRIPDQAIGLDPLTTRLMAWAMQDWRRVWFLNTFLAGTIVPRLQLDFVPAIACGAHVIILAQSEPRGIEDYVAAGAAIQRFWLTATQLGLQHQPEMTPLIFSRYTRNGVQFTQNEKAVGIARSVSRRLGEIVGSEILPRAVWMGRIGAGQPAEARSVRLPIERLLLRG